MSSLALSLCAPQSERRRFLYLYGEDLRRHGVRVHMTRGLDFARSPVDLFAYFECDFDVSCGVQDGRHADAMRSFSSRVDGVRTRPPRRGVSVWGGHTFLKSFSSSSLFT